MLSCAVIVPLQRNLRTELHPIRAFQRSSRCCGQPVGAKLGEVPVESFSQVVTHTQAISVPNRHEREILYTRVPAVHPVPFKQCFEAVEAIKLQYSVLFRFEGLGPLPISNAVKRVRLHLQWTHVWHDSLQVAAAARLTCS